MIAVIRIHGRVKVEKSVEETLYRLRLRRKYICVVLENPTKEQLGMIKKVKDFVAYGEIDEATYKELIEKRGKTANGKAKPFFRLHPPRRGIDSKKHFGVDKGVLGNNKEKINDLIRRML
jgi:large subunit ribosomal protein L30